MYISIKYWIWVDVKRMKSFVFIYTPVIQLYIFSVGFKGDAIVHCHNISSPEWHRIEMAICKCIYIVIAVCCYISTFGKKHYKTGRAICNAVCCINHSNLNQIECYFRFHLETAKYIHCYSSTKCTINRNEIADELSSYRIIIMWCIVIK